MRKICKNVYLFSELSDEAKEKAREKAREYYRLNLDYNDWWHNVYDDAKEIASLFGLIIDNIQFSGFWHQGDGASFTGSYDYKKGALKAVMSHAPNDEWLHAIVRQLHDLQRRHFYRLRASIKQSGRYVNEGTMSLDIYGISSDEWLDDKAEKEMTELMRDYARWIYEKLRIEYEYLISDENIDEMLVTGEYEFYENGEIV